MFVQVKLLSFFSVTDGLDDITDEECTVKLEKMKENMIKSYNYSQGMQNQISHLYLVYLIRVERASFLQTSD